ncbi:MAG: glycosyltransferase [Gemmatimonadales bacterium]|jgi:trehalose synthase
MKRVELASKSIKAYESHVNRVALAEIEALATPLRGARILHLNATAYGGGVAEILPTLTALQRDLGMEAEWHVLSGTDDFFDLTKKLHNCLQGMEMDFTPSHVGVYLKTLEANTEVFGRDWDIVVVHDPQPAGLTGILDGRRTGHWIWRCHVDTSTPGASAVEFLAPYMSYYDVSVFTLADYRVTPLSPNRTEFIYPSIDPLAPKNQCLSGSLARQILASRFDIDVSRPIVTQVSRFDPWKDPLGVIDAYRAVKREVPAVQLALVGNLADDDPEGIEYHQRTLQYAGDDPDIHVLSTLDRLSREEITHALEINAFQTGSDVIVQKSTREGFGLVVTEAMWKGAPVVAGRVGGIRHQIRDGANGYLASDVDECADRVMELLLNPRLRREMGFKARQSVQERFLTPRHVADYLRLFHSLLNG